MKETAGYAAASSERLPADGDVPALIGRRRALPALRDRREELGLRLADVAQAVRLDFRVVSKIEKGRYFATPAAAAAFATKLAQPIDELFEAPLVREGLASLNAYAKRRRRKSTALVHLADGLPSTVSVHGRRRVRRFVDPGELNRALAALPACLVEDCEAQPLASSGYCGEHWREAGLDARRLSRGELEAAAHAYRTEGRTGPEIASSTPSRSRKRDTLTEQAIYYRLRQAGVSIVPLSQRRAAAREQLGAAVVTAAELADRVGVAPSTVSRWVALGLDPTGTVSVYGPAARLFDPAEATAFLRSWARGGDGRRRSWENPDKVVRRLERRGLISSLAEARVVLERVERRHAELARRRRGRRPGASPPDYHLEWREAFEALAPVASRPGCDFGDCPAPANFELLVNGGAIVIRACADHSPRYEADLRVRLFSRRQAALEIARDDHRRHPERWEYDPSDLSRNAIERVLQAISRL